jgi:hypothetical protein
MQSARQFARPMQIVLKGSTNASVWNSDIDRLDHLFVM